MSNVAKVTLSSEVRIAKPYLFEKSKNEQGVEKGYEIQILIDKSNVQVLQQIDQLIAEAVANGPFANEPTAFFRKPLKDSMQPTPQSGKIPASSENGYGYGDCMYARVATKFQPQIMKFNAQGAMESVIDPNEVYSGMYAHVVISAYAYKMDGSKGVSLSLEAVLKSRDGEKIVGSGGGGGAVDASTAFAGIAAPVAAPVAQPAPAPAPAGFPGQAPAPNYLG